MMFPRKIFSAFLAGCLVFTLFAGCSSKFQPIRSSKAVIGYETQVSKDLAKLPPPKEPVVLAVYKFRDQTGQYKPGTGTTGWSTAVTQGATSMLIKALSDAGRGKWFSVLERESLTNLLNERKIIRQTRKQYIPKDAHNKIPPLPALLYAPVMLEGGIIAYENDLLTGGLGARYLGIGGNTQFRRDTVTIYLRAVSVKNGKVLKSVTTSKTIFSMKMDVGVFKFVGFKELLEVESGYSTNEPPQMAVLEAIEQAVYTLVVEGSIDGIWDFENPRYGQAIAKRYFRQQKMKARLRIDKQGNVTKVVALDKKRKKRRYRTKKVKQK